MVLIDNFPELGIGLVCEHETTHPNIPKSKLQKLVNYHQIIESNTSCNNNNYYNWSIGT